MARLIPGLTLDEGDDARGFGQADTNVLINGRRISGKSNGPLDALARIPLDALVRLEIVDGASLEIGGLSGQVLNVVTASGGRVSGRYRFSPETRTDHVPTRWGNGELALTGGGQNSEWTLRIANEQQRFGAEGPELVVDGTGQLLDRRTERVVDRIDRPGVSGSVSHKRQNGGVWNLTGEANGNLFRASESSVRAPAVGDVGERKLRETEDEFNFEVGADYEFDLGAGRLKLIGLHRFEDSPTEARVTFEFANGQPATGSVFKRQADEAETVLRSEYTVRLLGGDWQWSIEGAQNYLDIDSEFFNQDAGGELVPVALPGASARVEEDRVESTLSYGRSLARNVQVQASAGAEYSRISQSGEFGQTRDFVRPKGFVSLNWRANDRLDLSLQLERRVGQLNFSDVIASVNVNQGRVNVSNSNLVPPQSWLFSVQMQQALGAYGSITLGGFYEDISDIVDLVPVSDGAGVQGQAPGNIDSASRYGASVNATLLFDGVGWKGGRLDVEAQYTDSRVRDPLLGNRRQISDDDHLEYDIVVRQDFPNSRWAAGIEMFYREDTPLVRLDETSLFRPSRAFTRVFVENKNLFGATLRASVANLNDRGNIFSRTLFADRSAGDVRVRERRELDFGLIFRLEIEGNF